MNPHVSVASWNSVALLHLHLQSLLLDCFLSVHTFMCISTKGDPAPWGHWGMSGVVCGRHEWGASAILWVGTRMPLHTPQSRTAPVSAVPRGERPCSEPEELFKNK